MHKQKRNQTEKISQEILEKPEKGREEAKSLKIIEGEQVDEGHPKAISWRGIARTWKYAHAVCANILEMVLYPGYERPKDNRSFSNVQEGCE